MKKIVTLIIALAASFSFAQNSVEDNQSAKISTKSSTSKADELFKRMWYKEAAALYEKEFEKIDKKTTDLINDNKEFVRLLKRAGDSYFFNTDMKNAYRIYDRLISNYYEKVDPEYIFRYAHSLEGVGKYKEAKQWMKEFSKRTKKGDDRSGNFNQNEVSVEDILAIKPQFVLHNLSINGEYSDFGPMYYKDKLVYSSAIDSSNYHTRIYHWNEQPFLNMYVSNLNAIESDVKNIGEFSEKLNTKYHEATLAFSPDYKRVYFTRNNYDGELGRDSDGTNHLKLYSADLVTKGDVATWDNVKELPFNSEEYSVGHPTVSKDGKLLYFVSDMPGSIGATDVFVVDIYQEGNKTSYSKPRNLGDKVNTAGREMFPYITENTLYFASDGHLGLGGLDVFKSSIINKGNFDSPINLGAPLNSKKDDFSFIIKEDKNRGFVASNRDEGKGDDDIYSFVRIPLADEPKEICEQLVKGYISNSITGERIGNVMVTLFDEKNQKITTTTTDLNGKYNFDTTLGCSIKYKVEASKTGYGVKTKPFITDNENGETIVPLGLETLNELIVEEQGLLKIKIGIIYFNLNKSFIRNDAGIELNKIVVLMRQYPKMIIKIESHTDARNTDAYNLALSDRRAKSTRDYLISQGIETNRIKSAIGYGESRLINKCANGVTCSEAEHQLNRRSEFIILGM